MSNRIRYGVGIALVFLLVVFAVQNHEEVAVDFLFWDTSMPRAVLIFLVFAVGVGSGWILGARPRLKGREAERPSAEPGPTD